MMEHGFKNPSRVGIYYFPDDRHYAESHLEAWLPELRALGASWLVLHALPERNVPEAFIKGLLAAHITPIIHLKASLQKPPTPYEMQASFRAYADWGIKHVVLFDQPNQRESWGNAWAQQGLVSRFLDFFIPLGNEAMDVGLAPGLPPLKPTGDYWDTAFLRMSLEEMQSRNANQLLETLFVSADAQTAGNPVDWGAGGPERWAGTRAYRTPPGEQDQAGFHIFDWYNAITRAIIGAALPLALLKTGSDQVDTASHQQENLTILNAIQLLPENIFSCNFWLLATGEEDPHSSAAWYGSDGVCKPVVIAVKNWKEQNDLQPTTKVPIQIQEAIETSAYHQKGEREILSAELEINAAIPEAPFRPFNDPATTTQSIPTTKLSSPPIEAIQHYLLLPIYEWGVADWHLSVIQPFVKKYRPTIGFSTEEAKLAHKVTVVGGAQNFPEGALAELAALGCEVTQIEGDGTSIASKLATL